MSKTEEFLQVFLEGVISLLKAQQGDSGEMVHDKQKTKTLTKRKKCHETYVYIHLNIGYKPLLAYILRKLAHKNIHQAGDEVEMHVCTIFP